MTRLRSDTSLGEWVNNEVAGRHYGMLDDYMRVLTPLRSRAILVGSSSRVSGKGSLTTTSSIAMFRLSREQGSLLGSKRTSLGILSDVVQDMGVSCGHYAVRGRSV